MADSLKIEILKQLCYHREKMFVVFGLLAALWVVTAVGFTVIPAGTGAYAVNALNLVTLSVLLLVSGTLLAVCFRTDLRFR